MSVEALGRGNLEEFLAYCRKHRFDHDESYLSDHDLEAFSFESGEDAAFLLRDEDGGLRGVAALMLRPELRATGKARFRILHVEPELAPQEEARGYRLLVEALLPLARGLDWAYLFLPERAHRATEIVRSLGFSVERYAWLLERSLGAIPEPGLSSAYFFREARLRDRAGNPGTDAEDWCRVVNLAFAKMAGHTHLIPERLIGDLDPSLRFPDSYLFLCEKGNESPLGIVCTVRDVDDESGESSYLGPIAVLPGRQGRGFGRALLRAGLGAARRAGYLRCYLSVNSENAKATELYLGEGFSKKEVYVSWRRHP